MRVLLINTTYGRGGAAQIVHNLVGAFEHLGMQARALVAGADETLLSGRGRTIRSRRGLFERLTRRICRELGLSHCGILHTFALPWDREIKQADVLNLHNLHGGYFNFLALPLLTRGTPAVLTLHDMWPVTGHCVYSFDCERWKTGCGQCPYPEIHERVQRDATRLEQRLKRWAFAHSHLQFIAVSRWIQTVAQSALGARAPVHYIPNGIDLEIFAPRPQAAARRTLGLAGDRRIILYVAHRLDDPRKGFDLLVAALRRLPAKQCGTALLLVMGDAGAWAPAQIPLESDFMGFVSDDEKKALAFAAADVLVFPTRADNLPIVLQESLACALPMVSFDVGGVSELVRHGETGFLAPAQDVPRFADHLQQLLDNEDLRRRMSVRCRQVARSEYSLRLQAQRYQSLFEDVCRWHGQGRGRVGASQAN